MGIRVRCPICNRFGQSELNNLCKACDLKVFEKDVTDVCQGSYRVILSALNEFKAKSLEDISVSDRKIFINIIKRRMPGKRVGHIQRDRSKLEEYGYTYPGYTENPGIIKGVADIVKVE